jgi:TRAP-type C4-dicarboxylate transport system permease small subunit
MLSASPDDQSAGSPAPESRKRLLTPYFGYLGYFVGVGMISGGVVHYPLNTTYYGILIAAGVAVFLAATLLNEVVLAPVRPTTGRLVRLVGASLFLSFGIGMLSGGIQHFTDFPQRASILIPLGLALSFGAYLAREGSWVQYRRVATAGAVVFAACILMLFALQALAQRMEGGSHSHGSAALGKTSAAE